MVPTAPCSRAAWLLPLAIVLASCCKPADSAAPPSAAPTRQAGALPLELELEPPGGVLYKIEDELGMESVNFALTMRGETAFDRLGIVWGGGGVPRTESVIEAAALAPHRADARNDEPTLRNFHQLLPAALNLDRLEVTLLSGARVVGRVAVPLLRYQQRNRYRLPVRGCWQVSSKATGYRLQASGSPCLPD